MKTVYFDNAATTFIKPQRVYAETNRAFRKFSANSGRGSHFLSLEASEKIYECRLLIASAFGSTPENVIFTFNTTYALNMAIKGVAQRGDHFLLSNLEHNSTLRPVFKLNADGIIEYDVFDAYCGGDPTPERIISDISSRIKANTKCIICTHTSNICSTSLPIYEIGKLCRKRGIAFIVDAAQGAGHTPIDMRKNNIDILCLPAHKGLYGPQGVGVMILGDKISPDTLVEGGSGINSLIPEMPDSPPERYEAGTLPCYAIHGLRCGIEFVQKYGYSNISQKEAFLWDRLYRRLSPCEQIRIYDPNHRGSIFLFNVLGVNSSEVSRRLSSKGICVRSGYHCAALAHKSLSTDADGCGGAVRVSFSVFNTSEEIDALADAVLAIADTARK